MTETDSINKLIQGSTKHIKDGITANDNKLNRTIIILFSQLINTIVLSTFLIIVSMVSKYAAITIIIGYIVVYIYNKIVDFVNRFSEKEAS